MIIEQPSSLTANHADLLIADRDTFATIEFRKTDGAFVSHWLVSGIDTNGLPAMLLELSAPMSSDTEATLTAEANAFFESFVLPMARHLATTKGAGAKPQPLSVAAKANLFGYHMAYQFDQNRSGILSSQLKTECLFRMATYLGVFAPIKQIADFQGISLTAVEAQVKRARAAGTIPKASEVRARNKVSKGVQ